MRWESRIIVPKKISFSKYRLISIPKLRKHREKGKQERTYRHKISVPIKTKTAKTARKDKQKRTYRHKISVPIKTKTAKAERKGQTRKDL